MVRDHDKALRRMFRTEKPIPLPQEVVDIVETMEVLQRSISNNPQFSWADIISAIANTDCCRKLLEQDREFKERKRKAMQSQQTIEKEIKAIERGNPAPLEQPEEPKKKAGRPPNPKTEPVGA